MGQGYDEEYCYICDKTHSVCKKDVRAVLRTLVRRFGADYVREVFEIACDDVENEKST